MQLILDNLIALVVGGVLILALAAIVLTSGTDARAELGADVNRAALQDAITIVEHDLRNAGAGGAILAHRADLPVVGSRVAALEFWTLPDSAGQDPARVRYDVVGRDSVEVVRDGQPVRIATYMLERFVHDGTAYGRVGGSDRLSEFTVTLVDAASVPVTSPADARGLAVRLARLPDWGGDGIHRESRWETVIWPLNLTL